MRARLIMCLCLVAAACLVPLAANAVTQYTITDLGSYHPLSRAWDVNELGEVVGDFTASGSPTHAFLWQDGVMTDLGALDGLAAQSVGHGVNNSTQVVGYSVGLPFLWESGSMHALDPLTGQAYDINESSQVVGHDSQSRHAFLWDDGVVIDLGTLGGEGSDARGVNDAGQVVGFASMASGSEHAFLWESGVMQDLGTFGGGRSHAYDINNSTQVVGSAFSALDEKYAFRWEDGVMHSLGTLPGGRWSHGWGINNHGQVVGMSEVQTASYDVHAFLYEAGQMYDLNDLIPADSGWVLVEAAAINDAGQIVGYGTEPDGHTHAFLLTPIPEPSVLALAALSALGLPFSAGLRRMKLLRRRRWQG